MVNFTSEFEYKNQDEPSRKRSFVAGGQAYGFDYYVVSQGGMYPCVYVVLPKNHVFAGIHYADIPVDCHGGLTYGDGQLKGVKLNELEYVIGWDYAHFGDYVASFGADTTQKHWTTDEIVNEVTEVCKQLRELNDKEG